MCVCVSVCVCAVCVYGCVHVVFFGGRGICFFHFDFSVLCVCVCESVCVFNNMLQYEWKICTNNLCPMPHVVIRVIHQQEQHYNLVQYELKSRSVNLCQLFEQLEQAQRDLHVEDYSVSQNTLDNVSTHLSTETGH